MAAVLWLTRLAFVAFNVLLGVLFVMTNTDHCASVFEMKVGYALFGHVMSTTVVGDEFECQQKCLGNNSCKSFNVHPSADNKKHICELNNKTRKMKPRDFKKKKGATYYGSVKISCVDISHENMKTNRDHECHPGYSGKQCERRHDDLGVDCLDIKTRGHSKGNGMYWLDPDGGSHSNAFQAYCDMTSYNGGWTMCYTTDEYAKPRTEVAYNTRFSYGTDGYRTNCNDIPFTEIIFIDHQTGEKAYFKRAKNQQIKAADNYGKKADTYGLWNGFGAAMNGSYSYQLLICDTSFYSGFFVSGYTNCYKICDSWCLDTISPYFRTASTSSDFKGVAFNISGHESVSTRLMSVGLR